MLSLAFFVATLSSADQLHALFDKDWERQLREDPVSASYLGDRRYNDKWPDMSVAAITARAKEDDATAAALARIDKSTLSDEDKLNADLFADMLAVRHGIFEHKLWLLAVDQMGGVHSQDQLVAALRFDTVKDYDDWLARLRAFPALVDQNIALLREGKAEQWMQAKAAVARVPAQIKAQIVDDAGKSSFYAPFLRMPDSIPPAAQHRLQAAGKKLVLHSVVPSLKKWLAVVEGEYLPACPDVPGMGARKGGKETYAFLVRMHTTTNKTPEEIHALGLKEVARIRAEMEKVKARVGFKGPLSAFFTSLRTDPRFFPKSGEEILTSTRALAKKIDGRLVRVLKTMPRMPYGVEPVPDAIAPDQTTAYYSEPAADGSRPGIYFVNLYKPEARPKWEMVPLALHESVPGHHIQIALAQELTTLPKFRRYSTSYTAFVEGWGLYAESLGEDMGLYDDPYDKMGELTYEMWRAVRLVVDTGIHAEGWSRQKAIDYFLENTPKTRLDVENEVDRYIVWPGQALAYKIGQLELKALRARAEKKLGARFNLGEFHDAVLLEGALPLDVLDKRIDAWLAAPLATRGPTHG